MNNSKCSYRCFNPVCLAWMTEPGRKPYRVPAPIGSFHLTQIWPPTTFSTGRTESRHGSWWFCSAKCVIQYIQLSILRDTTKEERA